jgi:transposase
VSEIIRIGLDTSKHVFQLHGVDAQERPVLREQLRRSQMETFFAKLPPTEIGLEACGASHHWARRLTELGHEVKLLPPQYVKPYVKRGKSDSLDAEAICEAMSRPGMSFVPVKSQEQQAGAILLTVRDGLVKQRTMLINAIRGNAAEFGITAAKGARQVKAVLARAEAELPALAFRLLSLLGEQLAALEETLKAANAELMAWHRGNVLSRRLAGIPGVGPGSEPLRRTTSVRLRAMALVLRVPDPAAFASARGFAAWTGLTPRLDGTAGKNRPGRISKQGDETLRRLLVLGAMALIRRAQQGQGSAWLLGLLARKPPKLAAIALANKTARIAWAMMRSGEAYRGAAA